MTSAEHDQPSSGASPGADPHLDLQRILVPVDFTPASLHSLRYAARMAEKFGGSISLLHVVNCGVFNKVNRAALIESHRELIEEAEQQLEEVAAPELGDLPHTKVVRVGRPGVEILETAEAENSDLIVMAMHEYTGVRKMLHRDTCREVESEADCPVLVLHCDEAGEIEPKLWKGTTRSHIGEWVEQVFLKAFHTPSD